MFNIEVLPYILFALMAIPPFIFGFFKGWKAALVGAVVIFALSGAVIGISIAVYDSVLWPLFKGVFVHSGSGSDSNVLSEVSKPSVLGIMIYPILFLAWIVYAIFKKMLQKFMKPKITEKSNNENEIFRPRTLTGKVIGSVIYGSTGILVASAVAGSVGVLTTPTYKENFFTKTTSFMGKGLTFGQGYYDNEYQTLYEFLPETEKSKEMIALSRLFSLQTLKELKTQIEFDDMVMNVNQGDFSKGLQVVFNKDKASLAVIKLARSINKNGPVLDITPQNIPAQTALLGLALRNNNHLKLSPTALNSLIELLSTKSFIEFEKTKAYLDWVNAGDILKQMRDLRIAADNTLQESIKEKARLDALKITLAAQKLESENKKKTAIDELAAQKSAFEKARNDKNHQQPIMTTAMNTRDQSTNAFNTANAQLDTLKRQIANAESLLSSETLQKNSNTQEIQSLTNAIATLSSTLITLIREQSHLSSALSTLANELSSKVFLVTTTLNAMTAPQQSVDTIVADIRQLEQRKMTKNAAWLALVKEYNVLLNAAATPPIQAETDAISAKLSEVTIASRENMALANRIKNKNKILTAARGELFAKTSAYNAAIKLRNSKNDEHNAMNNRLIAKTSQITQNNQQQTNKGYTKTNLESDNTQLSMSIQAHNANLANWRPQVPPQEINVNSLRITKQNDEAEYTRESNKFNTLNEIYNKELAYKTKRETIISQETGKLSILNGPNGNDGTIQQNIDDIETYRRRVQTNETPKGTDWVAQKTAIDNEEKARKGLITALDYKVLMKKQYDKRKTAILDIYRTAFR